MEENFVWHPVGTRLATEEEHRERVARNMTAPRVVPVGVWPEPGMIYLVTSTNGEVDIDEFDIDGTKDWFWYDCGNVTAWMRFPLFSPENHDPFWHLCEECHPTENRNFLVCGKDSKYAVLPFDVGLKSFLNQNEFVQHPVAWAELPSPYQDKDPS